MINVSPIGRNALIQERLDFEVYDLKHKVRATFLQDLQQRFRCLPNGWDKIYALGRVEDEKFEEIHFFGGKTYKGGNDYEIYSDPQTIGHAVTCPDDTIKLLKELFLHN